MINEKIIEAASKIRTPLSIVSLIIIILYLLYNKILELQVFSSLSPENSYAIISQAMFYLFVLSMVGLVMGLSLFILPKIRTRRSQANPITQNEHNDHILNIVDASIIDDEKEIRVFRRTWLKEKSELLETLGSFPIIDIKLRNISALPVYLKYIVFNVKLISAIKHTSSAMTKLVAWEYNVLFSSTKPSDIITLAISQFVKPYDIDRFIVVVGTDGRNYRSLKYEFTMTLHYNEQDFVKTINLKAKMHPPRCLDRNCAANNIKHVEGGL